VGAAAPVHAAGPAPAGAHPGTAAPAPDHRSLPIVPGHERLAQLAEEIKGCTRCILHRERTQTVFARGNGSSGVVFIGEGPGEEEDRQGQPFVGPAGQLLDRMIAAMQLARDDVYVCNIVKCRPPRNRKPEPDEMNQCRPFLEEQLELLQPRVLVALGATAVQGLLGTTEGITRLRGQWKLYRGRVPVMPTFHPAYLLRQPQAKREVWDDLREVLRHLGRPLP
jgi:DNA polymerase